MPGGPGGKAKDHFVEHDSQTPYVALGRVLLGIDELGSHVEGSAADFLQSFPVDVHLPSEPVIGQLADVVLDQDVFWFYVPMDVALVQQHSEPLQDVDQNIQADFFWQLMFIGHQELFEVAGAQFQDDVGVVVSHSIVEHPNGVWAASLLHDLNFGLEGIQLGFVVEVGHGHLLDSHVFVGLEISDFENLAEASFSQGLTVRPVVALETELVIDHRRMRIHQNIILIYHNINSIWR